MRNLACAMAWVLFFAVSVRGESTWPQWRGPTRDGIVTDKPWPQTLAGIRQVWRVELGNGYAGPVVAADRVFTVESEGRHEIVRALDRNTGRELWKAQWEGGANVPFFAARNGNWVRSTPACDGQSLFVGGMRDLLVCLDAVTGRERWRVDFVERHKAAPPAFGLVCSPLVKGDVLYLQAGGAVVCLDKRDGREIWRSIADGGGMNGSAFSSPILATIAGREQLLVQTRKDLAGLDPATGKVLWSVAVPAFRGMNILTPIVRGDEVFTGAYGGSTSMFQIDSDGVQLKVAQKWTLPIQAYMSTPVVIEDHAYLHRRDLRLSCIDLKTGKECWNQRPDFSEYASLVANGTHILALAQTGHLVLIRHNPQKLQELDRRKISDQETWGHLVVCGRELYVREQKGLFRLDWGDPSAKQQ